MMQGAQVLREPGHSGFGQIRKVRHIVKPVSAVVLGHGAPCRWAITTRATTRAPGSTRGSAASSDYALVKACTNRDLDEGRHARIREKPPVHYSPNPTNRTGQQPCALSQAATVLTGDFGLDVRHESRNDQGHTTPRRIDQSPTLLHGG